jgi:hypothetical protein
MGLMGIFVYARGANGNEVMDGMDERQCTVDVDVNE